MAKKVFTKQVKTNGKWENVNNVFGITLKDDNRYVIQVSGVAKLTYSDQTPTFDCFTISYPQPFVYEKKSGEDLFILTDNIGAVVTIAEQSENGGGGSGGTVDQNYNPLSTNAQSGTAVAQALETISGGADIDDSTITKNSSNKIQAVGLVNQNTDAGATTPLKLWNGTKQQWESGGGTATYYEWSTASEVSSGNYIPYPYPQPDTQLNWKVAGGSGSDTVIAITPGSSNDVRIDLTTGGYGSGSDLNNPYHIVSSELEERFCVYPEILEDGVEVFQTTDNGQTWQSTQMYGFQSPFTPTEMGAIGNLIVAYNMNEPMFYATDVINQSNWTAYNSYFPIDKMFVGNRDFMMAHSQMAANKYVVSVQGPGGLVELNNVGDINMFALTDLYTYAEPNFIIIGERDGSKYSIYTENVNLGISYNTSAPLPNYTYTSIASIGSKVVLLAGNKAVYSSDSGATWSEATISSTNTYGKVHAAGDKFVVMGTNCVAYSYDMINWLEFALPTTHTDFSYTAGSAFAATDNGFVIIPACPNAPTGEPSTPFVTYANCFTTETSPTTASTVYSAPGTVSLKTITSVGTGTITLSDNNNYTLDGQIKSVSSSIGDVHPDYLCNINGVGVKIGNTVVAEKNSASGWTGMFTAEGGRMIRVENGLIVRVEPDF